MHALRLVAKCSMDGIMRNMRFGCAFRRKRSHIEDARTTCLQRKNAKEVERIASSEGTVAKEGLWVLSR